MKAYEWTKHYDPDYTQFQLPSGIRISYDGTMVLMRDRAYDIRTMVKTEFWKIVDIELTPEQKIEMVRLLMEQQ